MITGRRTVIKACIATIPMGETKGIGACFSRRKVVILTGISVFLLLFFIVRNKYFYESNYLRPAGINEIAVKMEGAKNNILKYVGWGMKTKKTEKVENVWDMWIGHNKHLNSIGDIYDKCDNKTRTKVGKVVLEADKQSGGVHITSYMNCSYDHEIKTSSAHLEVYYKGELLYERDYDMCEAALKLDTPYSCPVPKGKVLIVRDVATMPSYIPKGTYRISAYVKDQDGAEIGCTLAEFKTGETKG